MEVSALISGMVFHLDRIVTYTIAERGKRASSGGETEELARRRDLWMGPSGMSARARLLSAKPACMPMRRCSATIMRSIGCSAPIDADDLPRAPTEPCEASRTAWTSWAAHRDRRDQMADQEDRQVGRKLSAR